MDPVLAIFNVDIRLFEQVFEKHRMLIVEWWLP